MNDEQLDQVIGSLIERWYTRDVAADQCRFCNETLGEPTDDPQEKFCSEQCEERMDTVVQGRIAIGKRDMEQRGYD